MKNFGIHEHIRMISYIFSIVGMILFSLGIYFNAAAFGTPDSMQQMIELLSNVFKDTGTLCGTIGGGFVLISEGVKRSESSLNSQSETSS